MENEKLKAYKVYPDKIMPGKVVFDLHQTHGITFDISVHMFCRLGFVIDWHGFIRLAEENGWNTKNLVERCRHACKDAGYNDSVMETIGTLDDVR